MDDVRRSVGPEDLDRLYRDEYDPMLRLAVLMVGSRAVAEELVHDSFVSVAISSDVERPGGYLRTVVVNSCRMVLRHREVERRLAPEASSRTDHFEVIELREALRHLTFAQRAAIVLRYYADLSDGEIGEVLACRPSTVRSHLRRGLRQLRRELS